MRHTARIPNVVLAFTLAACSGAHPPAPQLTASSGEIAPQGEREQTADEQVKQALNRVAFGARPGEADAVRAIGVDRWIAQQLSPQKIDDRATDQFVSRFPTLTRSPSELLAAYPQPQQLIREKRQEMARNGETVAPRDSGGGKLAGLDLTSADSTRIMEAGRLSRKLLTELQTAKVARAVMSDRQLEEVMVDFWENHFTVFAGKGPERYFLAEYERETIRPHALGKFRDLLGAVAKSPAMLYYLDNWESTVEADRPALAARPNARGMMRARTRAFGAQARRQREEAASARTQRELRARAPRAAHARRRRRIHAGGRAERGARVHRMDRREATGERRLRVPSGAARCRRKDVSRPHAVLESRNRGWRAGARHRRDTSRDRALHRDEARASLRERLGAAGARRAVWRRRSLRTDGDIRECLRTIFTSPEFFSRAAYKAKVKSPFELVVSALRAVGAQPDSTPRTAQLVAKLGQPLYGHLAPNGYPETRRRVDQHRRDPRAHQLRAPRGVGARPRRIARAVERRKSAWRASARRAGGRRDPRHPRRRGIAGHAEGARERSESHGE